MLAAAAYPMITNVIHCALREYRSCKSSLNWSSVLTRSDVDPCLAQRMLRESGCSRSIPAVGPDNLIADGWLRDRGRVAVVYVQGSPKGGGAWASAQVISTRLMAGAPND